MPASRAIVPYTCNIRKWYSTYLYLEPATPSSRHIPVSRLSPAAQRALVKFKDGFCIGKVAGTVVGDSFVIDDGYPTMNLAAHLHLMEKGIAEPTERDIVALKPKPYYAKELTRQGIGTMALKDLIEHVLKTAPSVTYVKPESPDLLMRWLILKYRLRTGDFGWKLSIKKLASYLGIKR